MRNEFKFSIYTGCESKQRRTTYRVVHTGAGYVIEKYISDAHEWAEAYDERIRFASLTEVFKSKHFKDIFIKNK